MATELKTFTTPLGIDEEEGGDLTERFLAELENCGGNMFGIPLLKAYVKLLNLDLSRTSGYTEKGKYNDKLYRVGELLSERSEEYGSAHKIVKRLRKNVADLAQWVFENGGNINKQGVNLPLPEPEDAE